MKSFGMTKWGKAKKHLGLSIQWPKKSSRKSEGADLSPLSESGIDMLENNKVLVFLQSCSFDEPRQPDDRTQCQLNCMFDVGGMVSADVSNASLFGASTSRRRIGVCVCVD